ncbi:sickle tail protein homolog isoform X3 [Scleropages formosus]|uniref:KIAA1217 n=1 Tax=Scleropages formosus TaxID=113540 RepID=A0A8C9VAI1_SCLFO|nr:sickle tail protein homolog isoform X3 [Scleropages formosus]
MSKPSRLAGPPAAGAPSKLPSPRKESSGGRVRAVSIGEKLMRAGSDGNLLKHKSSGRPPQENPESRRKTSPSKEQPKGNLRATSPEDAEPLVRKPAAANGSSRLDPKSPRNAPRRHTVGGPRTSQEILAMQPSDMDRKREAFLEHLKQKYPHHASAIMGHQERLREQSRSPKHCASPQAAAADPAEHLCVASLDALELMSEGDGPSAFTRGSRSRASLPVVRSANQTKDRSLGVLYLQYGDETKAMRMPNEITGSDTIRALFVSAFPQHLNMKMLESPSVAIYMKDDVRNVYYELSDVRNITDHSCLKVYHKDPAQAFNHGSRPANGDARVHREALYGGREGQHSLRQPPLGSPAHGMASPLSPPPPLSMPPSPSRIPFGPRGATLPGGATLPRDRLASVPAGRAASPCPSAILERRDVKPDEDMGPAGVGVALARGDALYSDSYLLHEGRLSIASSHSGHPPDVVDHLGMSAYHRGPLRSPAGPYAGPESPEHHALYRQKSRKYSEKTPPPSPHRMVEVHASQGTHLPPQGAPLERASPVRQSFRKEGMETLVKARGGMASPVTPDLPPGSPNDPQTRERMKAMEAQIASLTGLVKHALLKGPGAAEAKENSSDRQAKAASPVHSASSGGASPILSARSSAALLESTSTPPPSSGPAPLQASLAHFRRSVADLRQQLQQMRQLQIQNQETLKLMLKQAEQEIGHKVADTLKRLEDPVQKQRALVEEERQKYLGMEERVLEQLGELELLVEELKKERVVTLKDVEDRAVSLQKVGDGLAELKGEFPALQTKMRAVLRVEVEAVRFLKEEPHKLDSILKRVKTLTEALGCLRRSATEGLLKGLEPVEADNPVAAETVPPRADSPPIALPEPHSSIVRTEVMPASPLVVQRAQSSPVHLQQSQQSAEPTAASLERPLSSPEPPAPSTQALFIEEIHTSREKSQQRALSIEAAEREWEEKRQNMTHYDGKEFEKVLQEAQANMMKGFPSFEATAEGEGSPAPSAAQHEEADAQRPETPPSEEAPQPESEANRPAPPPSEKPQKPPTEPKPPAEKLPRPGAAKAARLEAEKAGKSPPPPPPRRSYPPGSGLTTGRSGEVIFTSRKESVTMQEGEEVSPAQKSKPKARSPTESGPKLPTPAAPPSVVASAVPEEEDEGNKIMAELQVFQKCALKDVGLKRFVEPQVRELRAGALISPRERKQKAELRHEEKVAHKDENGNDAMRQSPGVIYYVTAQISKEPSCTAEDRPDSRVTTVAPSQVAHANIYDISQRQQELAADEPPLVPERPAADGPPNLTTVMSADPLKVGLCGGNDPEKATESSSSAQEGGVLESGPVHSRFSNEGVSSSFRLKVPSGLFPTAEAVLPKAGLEVEPVSVTEAGFSNPHQLEQGTLATVTNNKPPPPWPSQYVEAEGASLSPDLPGEEGPPPPDNIAFMITESRVQALSRGEYQQIVSTKAGNVQTVKVGENREMTTQEENGFDKKPVIIIFDEPMDIRSAYKRLSTIFECEEELERMLAEERIEEESEEAEALDSEGSGAQVKPSPDVVEGAVSTANGQSCHSSPELTAGSLPKGPPLAVQETPNEPAGDSKQDGKRKFRFKFPKKQLAALSQAIRTGTKTGKKTLQVVVYDEEEEPDGTLKEQKEARRFEIGRAKYPSDSGSTGSPDSQCRTDEIRKSTYRTLDSLEQTIKQLETTISEMGPRSPDGPAPQWSEKCQIQATDVRPRDAWEETANCPSKQAASPASLPRKTSHRKKSKPQLLPRPASATSEQSANPASSPSRMPVPASAKARQLPGGTDKAGKQQKLQDPQRQFRQANGTAKKAGGDIKATSPTLPASKIPAFCPNSGKSSPLSAPNSDTTNAINSSSHSSSSSKSSIPPSPATRLAPGPTPSNIPSLSNGSLKLPSPTYTGKSHAVSFSPQTHNGRPSPSSSSSACSFHTSPLSPVSPTPLIQGARSVRTIHTPSFTSYKPLNGKPAVPSATSSAKDAS